MNKLLSIQYRTRSVLKAVFYQLLILAKVLIKIRKKHKSAHVLD